jgi:cyanophycinase
MTYAWRFSLSLDNERSGYLLAIGGGMELSQENPLITKFSELSGGKSGRITVLPTASDFGEEIGPLYTDILNEFCDDVQYFLINKRKDIESRELIRRLKSSSGIFFTGGNQLRITSLLGGSEVMQILKQAARNAVIAGTSAGASALSSTMISWGRADVMAKGNLQMSPGLGLIRNMVIDSHFVKRGRISRLLHVASQNPGILGIGLAEDTGILLRTNNHSSSFRVIGSRQIIIVDGQDIRHSNIATVAENRPFSVTNVRVHALGPHYIYDYENHEIQIPDKIDEAQIYEPLSDVSDLPYRPKPGSSSHSK